jgi:hypothetical protein
MQTFVGTLIRMETPIVVVSGLPRSGTSLLMQMLAAGGVEPYTDGERAADEDNPRGYLELESVKRLRQGCDWVSEARGRSLKVISHLLDGLPSSEQYRVVFVERNMDEILSSQGKMIARRGATLPPQDAVRRSFESHLRAFDRLVAERPELAVLRVAYAEIVADPVEAAEAISKFVAAGGLPKPDAAAMAGAVDPLLYRNRRGS